MIAISLGWGTQSFALAAMSALGELPPVDVAIHADTGYERAATYEFAAKWTPWLEERGVRVVTVRPDEASQSAPGLNARGGVSLPAFSEYGGQFRRRQCTSDWKVKPIRRWYQANRNGERVLQWIGITCDEGRRAKPADVGYVFNVYPFLGIGQTMPDGQPWSRKRVVEWLKAHDLEVPPRSSCCFCPFMSGHEWRKIAETPADWERAVAVDEAIRDARLPGKLYCHKSLLPLREIDFTAQQELDLWGAECSGLCGV